MRDCECENVLEELSAYRDDGSGAGLDYGNDANACWLIRPKLPAHNARAGPASPAGAVRSITRSPSSASTSSTITIRLPVVRRPPRHRERRAADAEQRRRPHGHRGAGADDPVHGVGGANAEIPIRFTTDHSITESGFLFGWTTDVADAPLPAGACARGRHA